MQPPDPLKVEVNEVRVQPDGRGSRLGQCRRDLPAFGFERVDV